ncbi:phosphate butyryltransferase [Pseudalkalibacillus caeni]|uniref:Phosphate butyryltransferase n=1 Tax=Exobacillus caeni TaxID=2574798 RepID=A0A5R9F138_9BACL|nr:phosphate butyryltransferase [Pseudalkalibacillus caeni]TLS36389.1 phosphate butyryltransferase [Pseudalkalibacillus caeni]
MKLDRLIQVAAEQPDKIVAVAAAEDEEVIEAVKRAIQEEIASFLLFGKEKEIIHLLQKKGLDPTTTDKLKVLNASTPSDAAESAVKAVNSGDADVLMKGMVSTAVILKAVLNKEWGLRTGKVLSHVAAFEVPHMENLIFVTDAGMNIAPDLKQKSEIIKNAVSIANSIGIKRPKVAPIAAVEVINPDMQATLDAAALTQMNQRGQIKNCLIDGPLGLDNAISLEAAEHKGIESDVAGAADILMVPTIEVGNALYKSLIYFARAKVGAVIAGARAPIVLTSRADSAESKLYSIALAVNSTK